MTMRKAFALAAVDTLLMQPVEPLVVPTPLRAPTTGPRVNVRTLAGPAFGVPAVIRFRSATEGYRQRMVPRMLPQLLRQYFGVDPMPYQVDDLLDMFGGGRKVRLRPHYHGKTTGGCFWFQILSLMNDPNAAHGIVSPNDSGAKTLLWRIDAELTSNAELIRDYPWVGKEKGRLWNKHEIVVAGRTDRTNENPSIYATGAGDKTIRQRRFKGVYDDLEGLGTVTAGKREEIYRWTTLEAWRTFEAEGVRDRPLWWFQGTPFDPDSLFYRLEREADIEFNRLPWRYGPDHPKYPNRPILPVMKAKVEEMRRSDPAIFAFAMELDPTGGREDVLSMQDVVSAGHASRADLGRGVTFVGLDPAAGSQNKRADYAGISVNRIDWQRGEKYPLMETLMAFKYRQGALEQVHLAAYLAERFNCKVIIEGNSQQGETYRLLFRQYHPETSIELYQTTAQKKHDPHMGLTMLVSLLKQGRWHIIAPEGRKNMDEGKRALYNEITNFGNSRDDHIMMSIWFCVRWAYEHVRTRLHDTAPRPSVTFARPPGARFARSAILRPPSRAYTGPRLG